MKYYSLHRKAKEVSFKEAVTNGIASDRGLYFPKSITPLPPSFFESIEKRSNTEIALEVISQFVGDSIPRAALEGIIEDVLSFEFPVIPIENNVYVQELFHGPTMAFKDVGARFMARCLGYFSDVDQIASEVTVLVATSGDTGGAVARGFYEVDGVKVVILYPSGKVSDIQEKQLTTLGSNITALEVEGTFDDCQAYVKDAFMDESITSKLQLTSANSINVARWLPQMFYFFFAYKQLKHTGKPLVISVPSGNFGNICAGMMARTLGLPISQFIAAVNANDIVPRFIKTGNYSPRPSVATISNAMDVGDPSNFIRILELCDVEGIELSTILSSYSYSDIQTKAAMNTLNTQNGYIADPHGAVGYMGLKEYMKGLDVTGVFLETAHPVKFLPVVKEVVGKKLSLPPQIAKLMDESKKAIPIKTYDDLRAFLIDG